MSTTLLAPRRLWFLAVAFCVGWFSSDASLFAQAQPKLTQVTPLGLQVGGSTQLTLSGNQLDGLRGLLIPIEPDGARFIPAESVQVEGNAVRCTVSLKEDWDPGIYRVRFVTEQGMSAPQLMGIDACQQTTSTELASLPAAVTGRISGDQRLLASFPGEAGQVVWVDVEAQRIGSTGFRPVVRVLDSQGKQLAWSGPTPAANKDARVGLRIPQSGKYTVELHDVVYGAAGNTPFRLKIAPLQFAAQVLPAAGELGNEYHGHWVAPHIQSAADGSVTEPPDRAGQDREQDAERGDGGLGHLGPGDLAHDDAVNFQIETSVVGWQPIPLPAPTGWLGPAPQVLLGNAPVIFEGTDHEPDGWQTPGRAPLAIQGALSEGEKLDRYRIEVQPGHQYRCEVWAQRIGSPLDSFLLAVDEAGQQLAKNDDRPGTADPMVIFRVPDGQSTVRLAVRDLIGKRGDDYRYLLKVEDISHGEIAPRLTVDQLRVPAGGTETLVIPLQRQGFSGPLQLQVHGLPESWQVTGTTISPAASQALLTLTAPPAGNAGEFVEPSIVRLSLAADDPLLPTQFVARVADTLPEQALPWLTRDLALFTSQPQPLAVAWEAELPLIAWTGGSVSLPLRLQGALTESSAVRLRLLTTQTLPQKKVKEGNQEKFVDDIDRALRLREDLVLQPPATEAAAELLIPADLAPGRWGVVLVAEALSADGQQVVARQTTIVHELEVEEALRLSLGQPADEFRAKPGTSLDLPLQVTWGENFDATATLTVQGLPEGYQQQVVSLRAMPHKSLEATLRVTIPAEAKPEKLPGVSVVALAHDSTTNKPLASSRALPIKIVIE